MAGFSLELERLDDGESPERQSCELGCENGGERDWSEEATVDGNGPVVERQAQDWSPLDREMQHECADCHQRTSALLGWSRCQNGLLGNLREGLEMSGTSVVEMATAPLERSRERQMGWSVPKKGFKIYSGVDGGLQICQNVGGLAESVQLSAGRLHLAQDRGQWRQFAKIEKIRPRRGHCGDAVEMHQLPRGSKRTRQAGGKNFTGGFEWCRNVVMAPIGVDWRCKWHKVRPRMARE